MCLGIHMSKVTRKGNPVEGLLTTAQVAEQTGWSVATVNRKAASGELPVAFKVEGKRGLRLFDPAVVAQLDTDDEHRMTDLADTA